jgi:hypothetical protein
VCCISWEARPTEKVSLTSVWTHQDESINLPHARVEPNFG